MTTTPAIESGARPARRLVPHLVREHLFVAAAVVCLLAGGGFRFAAGTASGANAPAGGSAATACAAK